MNDMRKPENDQRPLAPDDQALVQGVLAGERRALAKTITLIESQRLDHQQRAQQVLSALLPYTGRSVRIGISGVPGVGKSTFIESLGLFLIGQGKRLAVLAVDPSSTVTGGSILGDKTRMELLSMRTEAFIRPSPSSGALGGVAERTREAMLACEAAGYDVIVIETVGVGQSETAVADMTDLFCLLQLPNAGDDLQAIKKGVMELADLVVINKADADPTAAQVARSHINNALSMIAGRGEDWAVPVLCLSALSAPEAANGVAQMWQEVERFVATRNESGRFQVRRQQQARGWMWQQIERELRQRFRHHTAVADHVAQFEADVVAGCMTPGDAATRLLSMFKG